MNQRWSWLYTECTNCHTTEKAHKGGGLCTTCYYRSYKRPNPARRADNLERFIHDLPAIFKSVGISGYAVSYNNGSVTIKKMGSTLSHTWNAEA